MFSDCCCIFIFRVFSYQDGDKGSTRSNSAKGLQKSFNKGKFFGLSTRRGIVVTTLYSKTCLKRPLKRRPNIGFQDGFKTHYCLMQVKGIAECFVKLPLVFKAFVLSISIVAA